MSTRADIETDHQHHLIKLLGRPVAEMPSRGVLFPHDRRYDPVRRITSTPEQLRRDYFSCRGVSVPAENDVSQRLSERMLSDDRPTCLIITCEQDPHADVVIHRLGERGVSFFRWHPFGEGHGVTFTPGGGMALHDELGRCASVAEFRTAWWREPRPPTPKEKMSSLDLHERTAALRALPAYFCGKWHSHPEGVQVADMKLHQLPLAARCGFLVPDYIVSSDLRAIESFMTRVGTVVLKPLSEASKAVELRSGKNLILVQTIAVQTLLQALRDGLACPVFVQQYIAKQFDVRLTVVGARIFAYRVMTQGGPAVDWRHDGFGHKKVSFEPIVVPFDAEQKISRYLAQLSLTSGCFDFSVDRSGQWWFLECNPIGQWLWLEFETGIRMSDSFADLLM